MDPSFSRTGDLQTQIQNYITLTNQKEMYSILFKSVFEALLELSIDKKYGIRNIFNNYGYENFYIGQARKWINMSLKYIFVHDVTRLDGYSNIYDYCHIPIDNIIILSIGYLKYSTAWSRINDYNISGFSKKN